MLCATERETDIVFSYYPGVIIPISIEERVEDKSHLSKVEQKMIMEKVLNLGSRDWFLISILAVCHETHLEIISTLILLFRKTKWCNILNLS